ncbi:DUF6939 family protein [Actinomadura adrarensis]|uniref:DUF6939 family protein n=1 Tax=Actinomadura adrarensis TaxID=1819600 RepID=A0ABW3CLF0_9ACTN
MARWPSLTPPAWTRPHRAGLTGTALLPYEQARWEIYLPSYRWVLENRTADLVDELRRLATDRDVVLLDYGKNDDVTDLSKPLSHAGLVRRYAEGRWPALDDLSSGRPG